MSNNKYLLILVNKNITKPNTMKILVAIACVLLLGCSTPDMENEPASIESKFIGRWIGNEKDQQIKGLEKHWVLDRYKDSTYVINFTVIEDGETYTQTEEGKWWIQDGKLYEHYSGTDIPDIYTFTIIDDRNMMIKIFSTGLEMANPQYEVLDTKIDIEENL